MKFITNYVLTKDSCFCFTDNQRKTTNNSYVFTPHDQFFVAGIWPSQIQRIFKKFLIHCKLSDPDFELIGPKWTELFVVMRKNNLLLLMVLFQF